MSSGPKHVGAARQKLVSLAFRFAPLWVVALALLAQIPIYDRSIIHVDEGQLVAIAARLLRGEVLYRDVYTGIFPGLYYSTAALFSLFGSDVRVTRLAQVAVNAGTALCLWLLGRRVMSAAWAALAPLLYAVLVVVGFPGLTMFNYSPLSLVLALFALLFLLRQLEAPRRADGIAAGLLLAGCALTKQNFGALTLLAFLIVILLRWRDGALAGRGLLRTLWPVAAAGGLASAAALVALISAGAGPALLDASLFALGRTQIESYADPFPAILGPHPSDDGRFVFLYTPAALYGYLVRGETLFGRPIPVWLWSGAIRVAYGGALLALAGGGLRLWLDRRADPPRRRRETRALVVFAGVLFLGIFPSAIWSHLAFVLAPLLLIAAWVLEGVHAWLCTRSAATARVFGIGVAVFAAAGTLAAARISFDVARWYPVPLSLPRASLHVSNDQAALYRGALRFVERCAPPRAPIFVAPDMPLIYFLADRPNPTPFDLVIPGKVDGSLIVERLEATATRCVVYGPRIYLQFAPFEELFPQVAELLRTRYREVVRIQGGSVEWLGLVRRDAS